MSLAADMTADLATLYADFGESVTFIHGPISASITGIFTAPFSALSPATGEVETTAPELRCKASDVTAAVHHDRIIRSGVTYYIVGIQPVEDGLEKILVLSRDRVL